MRKCLIYLLFIILLVGCQSQQPDTLYPDAENVYTIFKSLTTEKEYLTDDERNEVHKFQSIYVDNYKDYPSDKKLISEMEILIDSYHSYKTAIGLKNNDGEQMYKQRFDQSISVLDKQFNK